MVVAGVQDGGSLAGNDSSSASSRRGSSARPVLRRGATLDQFPVPATQYRPMAMPIALPMRKAAHWFVEFKRLMRDSIVGSE
jgi:hypothetical protein